MKISRIESGKASVSGCSPEARILPEDRPKGSTRSVDSAGKKLSPLEQGMSVAEAALRDVPDVREELVNSLKERVLKGEYCVSGAEVAEMVVRRLKADRIR